LAPVATDREGIAISVMVSFPDGDAVVWHRCHLTDIIDVLPGKMDLSRNKSNHHRE
jgi:hypothetical protein